MGNTRIYCKCCGRKIYETEASKIRFRNVGHTVISNDLIIMHCAPSNRDNSGMFSIFYTAYRNLSKYGEGFINDKRYINKINTGENYCKECFYKNF